MAASIPTGCKSVTPGPTPPPGPTPKPGTTSYANPDNGCMAGQVSFSSPDVPGDYCSQQCNMDSDCPSAPDGYGDAQCNVFDDDFNLWCGVLCNTQNPAACDPDNGFKCRDYYTGGVCTWDT